MSVHAGAHYDLDMKIFQKKIYNFLGMTLAATSSIDNGLFSLFGRRTSKSWLALFHLSLSGVSKYMSTWQLWRLSVQWLRKEDLIEQLQAFSSLQRTWWKQGFVSLVLLWEHLSASVCMVCLVIVVDLTSVIRLNERSSTTNMLNTLLGFWWCFSAWSSASFVP